MSQWVNYDGGYARNSLEILFRMYKLEHDNPNERCELEQYLKDNHPDEYKEFKDYEEKIEELIKRHNKDSGLPYRIDMSYGPVVAKLTGEEGELDKLISLSDSKMYEMKRSRDSYRR